MKTCISSDDLLELGNDAVTAYEKRISEIPSDLCAPFNTQAGLLLHDLQMLYGFTTKCARAAGEDLAAIACVWGVMVQVCDKCLFHLQQLHEQHPYCGADVFYDAALNIREKCLRLQKMHQ